MDKTLWAQTGHHVLHVTILQVEMRSVQCTLVTLLSDRKRQRHFKG
jgi:hypothetical protein